MPCCDRALGDVSAAPLVRPFERNPERFAVASALSKRIGPIANSDKVAEVMGPIADRADQEIAWMMLLDTHGLLRRIDPFARGARDRVGVPLVDALRSAIHEGTRYTILVHNHPSGVALPSSADASLTWDVANACWTVELLLLDHVIMGFREFYSFRETARWSRKWPDVQAGKYDPRSVWPWAAAA
jgi:DNA repair protein RadC